MAGESTSHYNYLPWKRYHAYSLSNIILSFQILNFTLTQAMMVLMTVSLIQTTLSFCICDYLVLRRRKRPEVCDLYSFAPLFVNYNQDKQRTAVSCFVFCFCECFEWCVCIFVYVFSWNTCMWVKIQTWRRIFPRIWCHDG